ncbi:MAG: trypsin-like peptidase domain-containing protein [Planctomycetota bacterium]|jgi:serine protease Do
MARAVQAARASVVNIRGEKTLGAGTAPVEADGMGRRVNGMGTGVVIDPRGYIVTNHHVIDGVQKIQVSTADGRQYVAQRIARDPETDLAIIKIKPIETLPIINIGTSSDLMPCEEVVAIGNAFGYEHTHTRGIISALHRPVQVSETQQYGDLIQTDASINPGNSGGPLLNVDGEMIGINVAVRAGADGIGFAIPVDEAMAVIADLMADHTTREAWHGVGLSSDPSQAAAAVVESVAKSSPAEKAGLEAGDVVTDVAEVPVNRPLDFHRALLGLNPGDQVELSVQRGEKTFSLILDLVEPPRDLKSSEGRYWELLGLELRPVPPKLFQQKYRTRYRGGLNVAAVRSGSPAATKGIRPGDVLVGMHVWETVSLEAVDYVVSRPDLASLNPVKFFILRGSKTLYGYLPVPVAMRTTQRR